MSLLAHIVPPLVLSLDSFRFKQVTGKVREWANLRRLASHKQSSLTQSTRPDYMGSLELPIPFILVDMILYELLIVFLNVPSVSSNSSSTF